MSTALCSTFSNLKIQSYTHHNIVINILEQYVYEVSIEFRRELLYSAHHTYTYAVQATQYYIYVCIILYN